MDRSQKCITDGNGVLDCPGYFGHIELAKPIFHVHFLKTVLKVLRCVSYRTSKLLINKEDEEREKRVYRTGMRISNPEARQRYFLKACSAKKEDTDGNPQPKYRLVPGTMTIQADYSWAKNQPDASGLGALEGKQELTPQEALRILKGISDEDCVALGFNPDFSRPEWMILTVFPVPPPPVRPSVAMDAGARSEDDLTHQLSEIIKANIRLQKQEEGGA